MAFGHDTHADDAAHVSDQRRWLCLHNHRRLPVQRLYRVHRGVVDGAIVFHQRNHKVNVDPCLAGWMDGMGLDQLGSNQHRQRQHDHDVHAQDGWNIGFITQLLLIRLLERILPSAPGVGLC